MTESAIIDPPCVPHVVGTSILSLTALSLHHKSHVTGVNTRQIGGSHEKGEPEGRDIEI